MTTPFVPIEPEAGAGARVAAAFGSIIVLLGGALFSVGTIFFAPVGMLIGGAIWRKRGRVLSMVGHWLAALIGVAAVVAAFAMVTAAFVPKGSFDQFRHTMDSASAAAATQPRRGTQADSAAAVLTRRAASSPRAMEVALAYGFGFAGIFMVLLFGTIGWVGGMLLGFAVKGRWPGTAPIASGSYPVGHA
jgi:hypothetical protein